MEAAVTVAARAVGGVAPGDHACCSFGSDDEHREIVARYARDAVARGERLLYLADRSEPAAIHALLADAALASTQLEIVHAGETFVVGGSFDHQRPAELLADHASRARADGFAALAVVAEMSWALDDPETLVAYEEAVTDIFEPGALHAVCLYDRRLFDGDVLLRVHRAHPFSIETDGAASAVRRGSLTVRERPGRAPLEIGGEVDLFGAPYLASRLREHVGHGRDVVLDARDLRFIDVAGCRALVDAASALAPERRLRVANAPTALERFLEICGWDEHPGLELL